MPTQSRRYLLFSLLLHSIILSLFVVSFEFHSPKFVLQNTDKEINASLMTDVPQKPVKIVQKPSRPFPEPKPVAPPLPKPPAAELKQPAIQEKTLIIPDKSQAESLQKQLLADIKKQTEKNQRVKQKALQTAFEKEMKELKVKTLQNQMRAEKNRLDTLHTQHMQGVVDKYKALILQAIGQHWVVPSHADKKRYAELLIRVSPDGTVLDVQLMKSSGNEGVDRSARAAVFKASPLPVPKEPDMFDAFRQFVLKVKPENILG